MAQLSRPYQIVLGVLVLFAAVWFIALRGSSTNTSGSGSSAAASAPATATPASTASTAAAEAKAAAAPTPIYHGAAPGVEGLTRAINKAHGAVATSQQNAKQLEEKSAQASDQTAAGASTAGPRPTSAAASVTRSKSSTAASLDKPAVTHKGASNGVSAPSKKSVSDASSMQASVERELKQGKVVAILFWNPKGSVDLAVQRELRAVGHALGGKLAVKDAEADQVGAFGSITHAVQVYQTPTILIVNKHGQATALTGLTDVFSIEQAIDEARHA